MILYVTAFLDINRENWTSFERSVDTYFEHFSPYLDLLRNSSSAMLIYIDEKHRRRLEKLCRNVKNVTILGISEEYMKFFEIWRRLKTEQEIMNSETYKKLVSHRLQFPEHTNAKYTLINHCKIEFLAKAISSMDSDYYCWTDFGFFAKRENVPRYLPNEQALYKVTKGGECVFYTGINEMRSVDFDPIFTLQNAPEVIGGFFFVCPKKAVLSYRNLYAETHQELQKIGIVDDDQHIVLQCIKKKPELFNVLVLGWHKAYKFLETLSFSNG